MIAFFSQLALNHHLRRDAGMVRSRLPQHILAAHPLKPDQQILQRVVQRVAHMQHAGDVWRRNDDGIGLRRGIAGWLEASGLFPCLVQARFGFGGIKSLVEHRFRRIPV